MSFDIYSESFYLANNPDIAAAVSAGIFQSGFQHFQQFGLLEGRTSISPFFNEQLYLQTYSDVAAAVANGVFSSGLQHFISNGEAEGRGLLQEIYSEQAYLTIYPDIAAAVGAGVFASGYEHFRNFGVSEGRLDAVFNEQFYLLQHSDVADAVSQGVFSSGLEHFLNFGRFEGRTAAAPFNEGSYLRLYPDVASLISQGVFSSGLEHFVAFGQAEGRQGHDFNEGLYLLFNFDVATAVAAGNFSTGLEHFLNIGQFEQSRLVFFSGTNGNDVVQSYGSGFISLVGTLFTLDSVLAGVPLNEGVGEIDVLIGSPNSFDAYVLGTSDIATQTDLQFYVGQGDSDYALIRGFDPILDSILLSGQPQDYVQTLGSNGLNISTTGGDLVGIVEGVTAPLATELVDEASFFYVSEQSIF